MNVIKAIVEFLPLLLTAINTVEALMGSGTGPAKKQAVLGVVDAALQRALSLDPKLAPLVEVFHKIADGLIDTVVNVLNVVGFFKKKDSATASA
jgi:hypothetical protein